MFWNKKKEEEVIKKKTPSYALLEAYQRRNEETQIKFYLDNCEPYADEIVVEPTTNKNDLMFEYRKVLQEVMDSKNLTTTKQKLAFLRGKRIHEGILARKVIDSIITELKDAEENKEPNA